MILYRIAKKQHVDDLSGEGARLYGGRWNKQGTSMLYFSSHLSLSVLEILVHADFSFITSEYYFLEVEIPDSKIGTYTSKDLVKNWRNNPPISRTQDVGSKWLKVNKELALSIPSAVLPSERNILVNPNHPSITTLKILKKKALDLDFRVLKKV